MSKVNKLSANLRRIACVEFDFKGAANVGAPRRRNQAGIPSVSSYRRFELVKHTEDFPLRYLVVVTVYCSKL
jgi:hypothetical protein